jgi:mono/diheme cytochrome c family protein
MISLILKKRLFRLIISVFALMMGTTFLSSCYYDNEEYLYPPGGQQSTCDTTNITYTANIAPIFADNCNGCHNSSSGNIILDNYTAQKNNIDKIWLAINHLPGASAMPKNGNKLSDCDIAKISRWKNLQMPSN